MMVAWHRRVVRCHLMNISLLLFTTNLFLFVNAGKSNNDPSYYVANSIANQVFTLDGNNFHIAINNPNNPLWLLKFYAPWCGHCKKMIPILENAVTKLDGKMAIGKIDCTIDQKFCNLYNIRGYPTLKFSLYGEIYDYPGGRTENDIIAFSQHMLRSDVEIISTSSNSIDVARQYAFEKTVDGVVFVLYHPNIKGDTLDEKLDSTPLSTIYGKAARKLKASCHFILIDNNNLNDNNIIGWNHNNNINEPFICRIEKDDQIPIRCYNNENLSSSITIDDLLTYIMKENIPTISHLTSFNFNRIGRKGRPLVIGVIESINNTQQLSHMKSLLTNYVHDNNDNNNKFKDQYYYGYLDGTTWSHFLKQFNITDNVPQIFVLDLPKKKYWQNYTYQLNIHNLLEAIDNGSEISKVVGNANNGMIDKMINMFVDHLPYSAIIVGIVFVLFIIAITFLFIPGDDDNYDDHHQYQQENINAILSKNEQQQQPIDENQNEKEKPMELKKDE